MKYFREADAVEEVCQRLIVRFLTISLATVRTTVQEVHANLTGPVRNYVPLLVERATNDRCWRLWPTSSRPKPGEKLLFLGFTWDRRRLVAAGRSMVADLLVPDPGRHREGSQYFARHSLTGWGRHPDAEEGHLLRCSADLMHPVGA